LKLGILNYKACNLSSVYNTLYNLGYDPVVINKSKDFDKVKKLIIPGVGSAKHCLEYLKQNKIFDEIIKYEKLGMPILGICLGMQIFAEKLYEHGESDGLGFIKGKIAKLNLKSKFNIGWKNIKLKKNDKRLFDKISENPTFYFCHSYHLELTKENYRYLVAHIDLNKEIPSIICKDNILGVQFHPEKSQNNGIKFISNFINNFK
tara:strand:+ start:2744 stop:3358 length:615 start_codon:yes stop_codon:yes gene_type:complete